MNTQENLEKSEVTEGASNEDMIQTDEEGLTSENAWKKITIGIYL